MKYFYGALFTLVYFFSSAQTTWYPVASGTPQKLNCISFGTDLVGYIGGEDSLLLKTVDGGKTWNRIAITSATNAWYNGITNIQFLDASNGYMIVNDQMYSTTDGAATWLAEQPNNTNMCFKRGLYFHDIQNGYVGGAMCFQGATVGNKVNGVWDTVEFIGTGGGNEQITNFDFRNQQLGMASCARNSFFRTTDGGATWDSISTDFDTTALSDVVFVNDSLVYATYEATGLEGAIVSFDAGLTWERDLGLATFAYPGFSSALVNNAGRLYLGGFPAWGNGGIIFDKTPLWWNYSIVDQPIWDMDTYGDSVVFAVGDSGYIVTNVAPSSIGIVETSQSSISVFPNPFQNEVQVSNLSRESKLQIFTTSGQLLREEVLPLGESVIDASALKKGVYLFLFENDKETKMMKLVK